MSILASFARRYGIGYTLLSDEGSRVISSLGLLNRHLEQQAAHYGATVRDYQQGVPYPGTFVIDERGVIVEKRFEQSYRVRAHAAALVRDRLIPDGTGRGVSATARTREIAATAWIAHATYRPYQRMDLHLAVAVAPGLHVYGRPIPDGFTPLSVEVDPLESLESLGPPQWPAGRLFSVAGLEEDFVVHEAAVQATVPLLFARNIGNVELVTRLRYQACSTDECFPPDEVVLRVPLEGLDNIR